MRERRRRKPSPSVNTPRLLKILRANLQQATEPKLKARLARAIASIKEKKEAA
jgi:hypothetical protein